MTELEKIKKELEILKSQNVVLLFENNEIKSKFSDLETEITKLQALNKHYEEQLKLNRQKKFGASSEKMNQDVTQLIFFDEAEKTVSENPIITEPTEENIIVDKPKTQKLKKAKRGEGFKHLPVETIEYFIEDTSCPKCGNELHKMKKEVRKELKIIPAKVTVIEHITYTYACRNCEKTGTEATIITPKNAPKALISKSFASPNLIAYIMYEKYVNSMPLDRQAKNFERFDIKLSKQNLCNWVLKGAKLLKPMYDALVKDLLTRDVLHADETTLEVLHEPGKEVTSKSYMWLYRTSRNTDKHVVIYDYRTGRSRQNIKDFLGDFSGILTTDGYAGYHIVEPEAILTGCMAHVRRKFIDADKISEGDNKVCKQIIEYIRILFKIEDEIQNKNYSTAKILEVRQEKSKPIFEKMYVLIDENQAITLPQSLLGKAFTYANNQKKYLSVFLKNGSVEISNNRAERSIKPFVIGRNNWLFSDTPNGATSSAIIYSITQTALENGLNPYKYLEFLFEEIRCGNDDFEKLKPWCEEIPEDCKIKK